jgi:hypothetical protein
VDQKTDCAFRHFYFSPSYLSLFLFLLIGLPAFGQITNAEEVARIPGQALARARELAASSRGAVDRSQSLQEPTWDF